MAIPLTVTRCADGLMLSSTKCSSFIASDKDEEMCAEYPEETELSTYPHIYLN